MAALVGSAALLAAAPVAILGSVRALAQQQMSGGDGGFVRVPPPGTAIAGGAGGTTASPNGTAGGDGSSQLGGAGGGGGSVNLTTGDGGTGGAGGQSGGGGAGGTVGTGGTVGSTTATNNAGTLTGGAGGTGGDGQLDSNNVTGGGGGGGGGGFGLLLSAGGSGLGNSGTITGGAGGNGGGGGMSGGGGGGAGGGALLLTGGGIFLNSATLQGGAGASGGSPGLGVSGNGGAGGVGAALTAGGTISNTMNGTIQGGEGGGSGGGLCFCLAGNSGQGGAGVFLPNGGIVTNAAGGLIAGGISGISIGGTSGAGGLGIVGAGLAITNAGRIAGGINTNIVLNNAIEFTGGANTLTLVGSSWLLAGNIALDTSATSVTFNQTTAQILGPPSAAAITGSGSVIQDGAMLTLSSANTYSGGTTISLGTLVLTVNSAAGTGGITMAAGTTLGLDNVAIANIVSGSGDPNISVTGASSMPTFTGTAGTTFNILGTDNSAITDILTVTTANATYPGATDVGGTATGSSVTLEGGAANAFGSTSAVSIFSGSVLDLGGFDQQIGSLSGGGTVTNSGASGTQTLTIGGGTATTFSGAVSDGSTALTALTLQNTGTDLTLSGANTYSGATTINSGSTLALSGTGSIVNSSVSDNATFDISGLTSGGTSIVSLSGTGALTLGSNTLTLSNATGTFSGTSSGSGGLTLTTGTETISSSQGYTGATTINGGTLKLTGSGSLASSSGVADGGTFDISGLSAGTSIASLSGAGALTLGSNTLTLSNASGTFSGTSSGSGGLTLTTGTETISSSQGYTGATTINGGTLKLTGSGSLASSSGVADGGTFDISGLSTGTSITSLSGSGVLTLGSNTLTLSNAVGTFSGTSSGSGGLTLTTGTETISSSQSYTGATTINGGTLTVNGSIADSTLTTVANGATLQGVGTVGALQVNSGGAFAPGAPGNAATSMAVSGNLTFAPGALYVTQVSPASASFADVSGTASLAGTVLATFASGSYVAKDYIILQSTGLNGTTFSALDTLGLPAGFATKLDYTTNPNDVTLDLTASLGAATPLPINQRNVANALDNFFNNGGSLPPNFVPIFGLTGSQLSPALTQLDGEDATGAQKGAFQLMSDFLNLMLDPSSGAGSMSGGGNAMGGAAPGFAPEQDDAALPPEVVQAYNAVLTKAPPQPQTFEQRWTAWGAAFGGTSATNGDPVVGSNNVTANDYGLASGADYRVSRDTVLGFALAGSGTNWNLAQGLGSGQSDAFQAGVYAKTHSGPWYVSAALAFTNNWFTTDRIAAMGDQLQAKFQGRSYGGRIETGYRYGLPVGSGLAGFTPYAAVQAQSLHTPSYSETDLTGGGFGLTYNAMSATDTRSELGARFDDLTMFGTMPLILRARLAWAHDWISNPALDAAFQTLPGTSFIVNGAAPPKNSALTSLGAELRITENWSLLGKFDGQFGNGAQTYAGNGTLRYAW
jgi:uncharacterized protein with beta-barrel porin domain